MARCSLGNVAAFQWKCAAVPAQRQFGISAIFFADMLFSMHTYATGIQEENQIRRGAPQKFLVRYRFRAGQICSWSVAIGVFLGGLVCLLGRGLSAARVRCAGGGRKTDTGM